MPYRRRTRTFQSSSPGGANVHPPWMHTIQHPELHLDRCSRFLHSSRHSCFILYNKPPLFPSKLLLRMGVSGSPSIRENFGPCSQVHISVVFRSVKPLLQGSRFWQTDRQTDRPRYSVCNNRAHTQYCNTT